MASRKTRSRACIIGNFDFGRVVPEMLMGNIEQVLQNILHAVPFISSDDYQQ
jgi:hypothetical protein